MRTWITFILLTVAILAAAQGLRNPAFVANLHYVESGEAPATPWSPTNVSGLQLWFRGEDLTGLATEGSSVSNWPSAVPGKPERYATNATEAAWPRMTNTFNGRTGTNALSWDGTDDIFYITNAADVFRGIQSCTIASCLRIGGNTGIKTILYASGASAGSAREILYSDSAEKIVLSHRSLDADTAVSATVGSASSVASAISLLVSSVHTNTTAVTGSALTVWTNNVLATNGPGASPTNTQNSASVKVCIGNLTTWPLLGETAEIIVWVPALSAADRTNCWLYFSNKYGLP